MMKSRFLIHMIVPVGLLTPRGLLLRAGLIAGFFLFCHAAGWREATTALSGVDPAAAGGGLHAMHGLLYALAHVGVTVAAPILALAAIMLAALEKVVTAKTVMGRNS